MKRFILLAVLILSLVATYSYADKEGHMMGSGMMGSPGYGEAEKSGSQPYGMMGYGMRPGGMGPGMMGYGGYGMMNRGMMGPGMMGYGGYGMMNRGMMGPGMMGYGGYGMMNRGMMGPGMMGEYNTETYKKYMDETLDLRKKLHNMKFEYSEAARNPKTTRETVSTLEKEIWDLQKEINEKWQK